MILVSVIRVISDIHGRWRARRRRRQTDRTVQREMGALPPGVRHDLGWPRMRQGRAHQK